MLTSGMDCSVVALKRGNARGARGAGHPLDDTLTVANRRRDEPWSHRGRRQPSLGGTSRMTGDRLVRICEGSRVKFLRSTRRQSWRPKMSRSNDRLWQRVRSRALWKTHLLSQSELTRLASVQDRLTSICTSLMEPSLRKSLIQSRMLRHGRLVEPGDISQAANADMTLGAVPTHEQHLCKKYPPCGRRRTLRAGAARRRHS
jgi:hypothetical protein